MTTNYKRGFNAVQPPSRRYAPRGEKIGRGRLENRPVKVKNFVSRVSISWSVHGVGEWERKGGVENLRVTGRGRPRALASPRSAATAAPAITDRSHRRPAASDGRSLTYEPPSRRDPVSAVINPRDRPRARDLPATLERLNLRRCSCLSPHEFAVGVPTANSKSAIASSTSTDRPRSSWKVVHHPAKALRVGKRFP